MMPGLPQGYIRFGSAAHRILQYMHGLKGKPVTMLELTIQLDMEPRLVAVTLGRLFKGYAVPTGFKRYIYRRGKAPKYRTGETTQWKWSTEVLSDRTFLQGYRPATSAERTRAYRQRLKERSCFGPPSVSVFDFRGRIKL